MPIASFQNKIFTVSSTKKSPLMGLNWSGGLETEAQGKLKDKPSTYIKGESLNTMSFEVPLRVDFKMNPRKEIEDWEAIMSREKPSLFILGTKPLGKNKWLLKSVSVSDPEIDSKGNILKALLKLEFEEYVRAGTASASSKTKAKKDTKSPAIGLSGASLTPSNYIFDPPDKVESKRINPNIRMG
jgi:hypothetical protein